MVMVFGMDRTGYAYLAPDGQKLFIITMKEGTVHSWEEFY